MKSELIKKIRDKKAKIGIIGLGYVGLPLLLRFAEVGYHVVGFDIDSIKVASINAGKSYISHINAQRIHEFRFRIEATTNFTQIAEVDAIILCVPTPLNKYREPDLSFIIGTMEGILPFLRAGQIISLQSTTYPGTTDEELAPRIQARGFVLGQDYFLVFAPEREDPGNPHFVTATIPKVCGGYTPACLEVGVKLYESVIAKVVPVSSTKTAEMTKLLENIHRAVNIGLANEMKIIAEKMGLDIYEIIDAAATKPFGFVPYYPGPGIGGHCIPLDPFYLTWKAREFGLHTRFIELAGEINKAMPEWVVGKIILALNERLIALKGSRVLMLGIAYKKNVDDMRESPSVHIMELLRSKGAIVAYSDPHVPVFPKMREHHFELASVPLNPQSLSEYDVVVLATPHTAFDYQLIKEHARLIVDTRGVYRKEVAANIVKA